SLTMRCCVMAKPYWCHTPDRMTVTSNSVGSPAEEVLFSAQPGRSNGERSSQPLQQKKRRPKAAQSGFVH
ncbi:hypothetical protein ABTQ07_22950, partial [Acinetobacter baumannii]